MVTTTQRANYTRPWLYQKQEAAIFAPERYSIISASTKAGKTIGCLIWLAEQAMAGQRGNNFWWVAPIFPQAKIAFRRMKAGLAELDRVGLLGVNESELTITLPNGAVMWFKGADKPDSLYGEDVYAAVIDEASRCKEEAWHAVRSTLTATRGPIRIIGNVKGRRNWAYHLGERAKSGEPNMAYHKITAYDAAEAGVIDASEIEDAQRQLPEGVFRELYLAEPTDDGGNPFGISAIAACVAPLSSQPPYLWGWDLAKSVDWTVGIALDVNGHVCRLERFQRPWQDTIRGIKQVTSGTLALVDSTGVGDPVLEALQADGGANFTGFHFSSNSKQQLMEGLAVAIQQQTIRYPAGVITAELESYEYVYSRTGVRYSAPPGLHDDCVCALALAVSQYSRPVVEFSYAVAGERASVPWKLGR